jgi:hypothetical protein
MDPENAKLAIEATFDAEGFEWIGRPTLFALTGYNTEADFIQAQLLVAGLVQSILTVDADQQAATAGISGVLLQPKGLGKVVPLPMLGTAAFRTHVEPILQGLTADLALIETFLVEVKAKIAAQTEERQALIQV